VIFTQAEPRRRAGFSLVTMLLMMYRQQTKYLLGPTCTAPKHSAFASADGG